MTEGQLGSLYENTDPNLNLDKMPFNMTPTSKKRKSALLQNLVRDKILKSFHLKPEDVITANNGQNGPDIKLSKVAQN